MRAHFDPSTGEVENQKGEHTCDHSVGEVESQEQEHTCDPSVGEVDTISWCSLTIQLSLFDKLQAVREADSQNTEDGVRRATAEADLCPPLVCTLTCTCGHTFTYI